MWGKEWACPVGGKRADSSLLAPSGGSPCGIRGMTAICPSNRGDWRFFFHWGGAKHGYGRLPKWPTGADCKSAGLRLRWFESITYHHSLVVVKKGGYPNSTRVFLPSTVFSFCAFRLFPSLEFLSGWMRIKPSKSNKPMPGLWDFASSTQQTRAQRNLALGNGVVVAFRIKFWTVWTPNFARPPLSSAGGRAKL
jgi:hypothetical protein